MNAHDLSIKLAENAASVAQYLLPAGKKSGGEWKAGDIAGNGGKSLSVRLSGAKAGVWSDFSTGAAGDLLDLWMACRSVSLPEAIKEAKHFLGVKDSMPIRSQKAYKLPEKPKCSRPKSKVRAWLNSRGLTDETIDAFKIGEQDAGGKFYAVFPYLREGKLINAKYRNPDEKKDMRQEGGAEPCLFGWHLIPDTCRVVTLTEGEIDAMTLHQHGIPALSCNAGANNHQWIENDWERLDRFSEILIAYDNDDHGNKGAEELTRRLGAERCRRVIFEEFKDANEYLLSGADADDFKMCIKSAKYTDPAELRQMSDFMDKVKSLFYPAKGEQDPVLYLDQALEFFHFRGGELSVWTGINGHGKSLLLSQVILGLANQGVRTCIFSGEMKPEMQLKRMSKQATGYDKPDVKDLDRVSEYLRDKIWVFDLVGSAKIDRLLEVFEYANKRYGITHFVIDSLMCLDVPEDGHGAITAQKSAIQKLCEFARRHNCHMHLVAHPRKGADENTAPGKMDIAGSSKITDGADNVFTVWSARHDESNGTTIDPDAKLILNKQRNGEIQHWTTVLWFVKASNQFVSTSSRRAVRLINDGASNHAGF